MITIPSIVCFYIRLILNFNFMKRLLPFVLFLPTLLLAQKVFLIGDAGEPKNPHKNFELLKEKFSVADNDDVLIFLGDNIYPKGLPGKEHPQRAEMEAKLIPQLELMESFPGKSFILPGNHDWAQGRKYGLENALHMEAFILDYFQGENKFLPLAGCPGPVEVPITSQSTLILLNTQYFLHPWDKPAEDSSCGSKSTLEALEELKNVVKRNAGKHILIAAHHPVYTYGEHNGNFSFKQHLFPLPVLGSIHPAFRKLIGNIQDNTHPKYKAIMKQIVAAMNEASHVVYAAGHEHSLQHIERDSHHFIVSGSGSKTSHVKQGKYSAFAKSEQGFAILDLHDSGKAEVAYYGIDSGLLFEKELYQKELFQSSIPEEHLTYKDSSIVTVASTKYHKNGENRWMGANYRDVWNTPIEVDIFDIGYEHGGLQILKKGGGQQTKSLRMEAEDGRQYVLRSIEKYPENAIPPALRKTFAQEIVEDQISSSHPYGAFIVPTLAEAAKIYHTNPKPVYIPNDPRFGQYRTTFSGTLSLYEERPNGAAAGDPYFGMADDVESTFSVIEKLRKDNDHTVDQHFVVRNRLFDMWIGDWDRHDDQWRWAEFDKKDGKLFRPIPRDRDQAFFINEGIIPFFASRKWALPKIEGFDEEVRWAPGLSQNARFFDRSFMNELEWEDWMEQITFLQSNLTNEVIDRAIDEWPDPIQKLTAERVRQGLVARRKDMPRYAHQLYLFLAKEVEVIGSDIHEYFSVTHLPNGDAKVQVRKRKKDGAIKQILYERTFHPEETREVRLYGLDGEDVFKIEGEENPKISIRIIGGTDRDLIINGNGEQRLQKVKVYDRLKSTRVQGSSKGILKLSEDPNVNKYDRKAFKYDLLIPLVLAGANPDDGLFLGGGFSYTQHGWRKEPFASKHTFVSKYAMETDAFSLAYKGSFTDLIGTWDLKPRLIVERPFGVNNYFGLGNETLFTKGLSVGSDDDDIDFYRYQHEKIEVAFDLVKGIGSYGNLFIGTGYRSIEVKNNPNRFIANENTTHLFDDNGYLIGKIGVSVDTRKNKVMPTEGLTASAGIEHLEALTDLSQSVTRLSADWAFYLSFKLPATTIIANRIGAAHNVGDYEFFNANILGGRTNLRGYRMTRFYGDTYFFHNLDVRLKLFSFRSYLFPGQFGILGFHDTGRVWVDEEMSNSWHTGKGFGLWVSPINSFVLNLNYGFGDDGQIPSFYFGFFF